MDAVETKVSLSDFSQQVRRGHVDISELYFILLDAAAITPSLVLNKNPKVKVGRRLALFKIGTPGVQRLFKQGGAVYASLRNSMKASKLAVSKFTHFLHPKTSDTKFTSATCKFKGMNTFARFIKEVWYKDLASNDELAKENNGVKFSLIC